MSAPSTPETILQVNVGTAIGPMFVGNVLNWLLMGILIMQIYNYWRNFTEDRIAIKLLVVAVFCLDLVQTVLGTHLSWWWSVTTWGDVASFQTSPWSSTSIVFLCVLISVMVQVFYASRIWVLRKSILTRLLAGLIVVLAVTQCVLGLVASALVQKDLTQENLLKLHPMFISWLLGSLLTDTLITGSMIWLLHTSKSATDMTGTHNLINRLILNTVQTGALTVVVAALQIFLFARYTETNYYFTTAYILGKLYSNSFIATLNARASRRQPIMNSVQSESFAMRIQVSRQVERREADLKMPSAPDSLQWATREEADAVTYAKNQERV